MSELNLTPREVFIAVPVSDRLPENGTHCFLETNYGKLKDVGTVPNINKSDGEFLESMGVTHWLEKITAIPLSEEELRKVFEAGESRTVSFEGFIDIYNNTPKEKEDGRIR